LGAHHINNALFSFILVKGLADNAHPGPAHISAVSALCGARRRLSVQPKT
jgi:hypothetical protein